MFMKIVLCVADFELLFCKLFATWSAFLMQISYGQKKWYCLLEFVFGILVLLLYTYIESGMYFICFFYDKSPYRWQELLTVGLLKVLVNW